MMDTKKKNKRTVKQIKYLNWLHEHIKDSFYLKLKTFIENRGDQLLTIRDDYINSSMKINIQCPFGHMYTIRASTAMHFQKKTKYSNCPICRKEKIIELLKTACKIGNIEQLEEYKGYNTHLQWKCKKCKRIWSTTPNAIRSGQGCPYCAHRYSRGEEIVRKVFNYLFNEKFEKVRPKWLTSHKGGRMELDGYAESLKLAFEYNGIQHYKCVAYMNEKAFNDVQYRDNLKQELCHKNNILLVVIKYFNNEFSDNDHFNYIIDSIRKKNIHINESKIKQANIEELFNVSSIDQIKLAQKRAEKVGLIFLGLKNNDKTYRLEWRGNDIKYWYKCKKCKQLWEKCGCSVQQRHGCNYCMHKRKNTYTYKEAREAVQKLNIRSLRDYQREYKNDPKLPGRPEEYYKNSGWTTIDDFFGKPFYDLYTYEEAKQALQKLKIKNCKDYEKNAKKLNSKLPSHPHEYYKKTGKWINWNIFLGKKEFNPYTTYDDAKNATLILNISSGEEYLKRYDEDSKLPSCPDETYKNSGWINWFTFLNKRNPRIYYTSYKEAKSAIKKLKIKTKRTYEKDYKKDLRLPPSPDNCYKNKGWTNWYDFLGKVKLKDKS